MNLILCRGFRPARVEQAIRNQTEERLQHGQPEDNDADDLMCSHRELTEEYKYDDETRQNESCSNSLEGHMNFEPRCCEDFEVARKEWASEQQRAPRNDHQYAVQLTPVCRSVAADATTEEIYLHASFRQVLKTK